jgi:hypothetical protein
MTAAPPQATISGDERVERKREQRAFERDEVFV